MAAVLTDKVWELGGNRRLDGRGGEDGRIGVEFVACSVGMRLQGTRADAAGQRYGRILRGTATRLVMDDINPEYKPPK
jgi:hypothetical protein